MKSVYLREADTYWQTDEKAMDIHTKLPAGTYTVGAHPMRGWYVKSIDSFDIKGKLYGDISKRADRILSTFNDRPNQTGVLLTGEKGSGKTMLAKLISKKASAEFGYPTLIINSPFTGDGFNTFIQSIDQPCVIVFDEFEKVFDEKEQEAILTLLDGVYPSKKLFVLTCNDKYRINQHMRNRPGRIFYALEYKGLDLAFIEEYCRDNLKDQSYVQSICRLSTLFDNFNFDMLKALIEDMNRYGESPHQALEMLNAKPFVEGSQRHKVRVLWQGNEVKEDLTYPSVLRGNPIAQEHLSVSVQVPTGKDEDGDDTYDHHELEISARDLKRVDAEQGTFTYVIKEGTPDQSVVIFTREVTQSTYDWRHAF